MALTLTLTLTLTPTLILTLILTLTMTHFVQFGHCIIGVRATTAPTVAPDQPRKISDDLHQGVVGGALAVGKPRHELLTHFAPSTGGFGVVVVAVRQMRVGSVWLSLRLG